jgi:hypothetical protein
MPTPLVTKGWRGRVKARSAGQSDTGIATFIVSGATDENAAMDAVFTTFGIEVNSQWDPTDPFNTLRCRSVTPRRLDGPMTFEVVCAFEVPAAGSFQKTVSPLLVPTRYKWDDCIEEFPFDRDIDNNAITNSAHFPPSSPPTKRIIKKIISIRWNAPYYDYATLKAFENTVCTDTIQLPEPGGFFAIFGPGTLFCGSLIPEREYTVHDTFVPMVMTLEGYDQSQFNPGLTEPFQLHLLDEGSVGYRADQVTEGNFCTAAGVQVASDIHLDGTGKPISSKIVLDDLSAPASALHSPPAGSVVETSSDPNWPAVYLRFKKYKKVPFFPLIVGLP